MGTSLTSLSSHVSFHRGSPRLILEVYVQKKCSWTEGRGPSQQGHPLPSVGSHHSSAHDSDSHLCAYLFASALGLPVPTEQGLALVHLSIAGSYLGLSRDL